MHPQGDGGRPRTLYPQGVSRRAAFLDIVLATLALVLTLAMLASLGFGVPATDAQHLDGVGIVLAMVSALPLVVRSRWPLTVYAVTAIATLVLVGLRYPVDAPFGPLIAANAVALTYSGDARRSRRVLAVFAVNLFIPAIAAVYLVRGTQLREVASPLIAWALVFLGVWIAGDRARLRQIRMLELEQRAARVAAEAERERRLAVAEERIRIARELHDSAGHAINVILVQAGAARLLQDRDPKRSRESIETIERVARSTVTDIDRIVHALREDGPDQPPANPSALDELINSYAAAGLSIESDLDGGPRPLPHSVAWASYRILQEALTNAVRHGTGRATVVLRFGPPHLEITVANRTAAAASSDEVASERRGHGIVGMRERAAVLGGTLVAATHGDEFRLQARLPYDERAT